MHDIRHPFVLRSPSERPEAYSAEAMRELDRRTIEDVGVPSAVLMERAALGVTAAVLERHPGRHTLILCGRGNNGGDGLAAARQLHQAGHPVACVVVAASLADLSDDAAANYRAAEAAGVNLRLGEVPEYLWEESELLVDCLLGTGATGELREPVLSVARRLNDRARRGAAVLAVDVPTGVDATTGRVAEDTVAADLTVALHAAKAGLLAPPGSEAAGEVLVWDIGISASPDVEADVRAVTAAEAAVPGPRPDDHKYRAGHVAVIAGSDRYPGAALLTARAAARFGAGYVEVMTTSAVRGVVAAHSPEIVVRVVGKGACLTEPAALREAVDGGRVGGVVIGPGLGRADETMEAVRRLVLQSETPAILDADALYAFNGRLEQLRSRAGLVLTPHAGEMAGLLGVEADEIAAAHLEAVRAAADQSGQVVLLKGSNTLIATEGGPVWAVLQGPPELASAGTGDVLSGCVGAALARGMDPLSAARAAAWVHAEAGMQAAATFGAGLIAEDVIEALPSVVTERMERRKPGWTS